MQELRILLLAADPLARAALAALIENDDDDDWLHVIGRADGLGDWDDLLALFQCDLVLCDLGWQGSFELPDLRELAVPVVALVEDEDAAPAAWRAGAQGILRRSASGQALRAALQAVAAGLLTFDRSIMPDALLTTIGDPPALIDPLTLREQEVLTLMARGLTNRAIAHALQISEHTVKFHVNAVLSKLGAQSRTEAAVKATRLGLLSL